MPYLSNIITKVTNNVINLPGWQTNRKIVVIESDDWGSIRMPSIEIYEKLNKNGFNLHSHPYMCYDSLASEDDLTALFEVLSSIKDKNGKYAKITANCIVANPDFEKIKDSGFQSYYYEPFYKTLKRYPKHGNSFSLWKEGIQNELFVPQFHGREHLNVASWMKGLQNDDIMLHKAFENEMISISSVKSEFRNAFMEAFDCRNKIEENAYKDIVQSGLLMFKEMFGYNSSSFIAPCYTWPISLEAILHKNGVKTIQGIIYQSIPNHSENVTDYKKRMHFMGTLNSIGQTYLMRNCYFEPTINKNINAVDNCMNRIEIAFRWRKPAIISMHRLNVIGAIHEKNRTDNLKLLKQLLIKITKKYPDVEFMSSDELGQLIMNERKKNSFSNAIYG